MNQIERDPRHLTPYPDPLTKAFGALAVYHEGNNIGISNRPWTCVLGQVEITKPDHSHHVFTNMIPGHSVICIDNVPNETKAWKILHRYKGVNNGVAWDIQPNGDCYYTTEQTTPAKAILIGRIQNGVSSIIGTYPLDYTWGSAGRLESVEHDGHGTFRVWVSYSGDDGNEYFEFSVDHPITGKLGAYFYGTGTHVAHLCYVTFEGPSQGLLPVSASLVMNLGALESSDTTHYTQDGWGSSIERDKQHYCQTNDGRIHFFSEGIPQYGQTGVYGLYHHISTDGGRTFTSHHVPDSAYTLSGFAIRSLTVSCDGTNIMVMFNRTWQSSSDKYREKWYDGAQWYESVSLPGPWEDSSERMYASIYALGKWWMVYDDELWFKTSRTDEWTVFEYLYWDEYWEEWYMESWIPIILNEYWGADFYSLAEVDGKIFIGTTRRDGESWYRRTVGIWFDGESYSEIILLDDLVDVTEERVESSCALHVDVEGTLHVAFTKGILYNEFYDVNSIYYRTWAFTDKLCHRTYKNGKWSKLTELQPSMGEEPGYRGGLFLTPQITSDKAKNLYLLCGGYPWNEGNGVFCWTKKLKDAEFKTYPYGHAAVEMHRYGFVVYQPHASERVHLDAGCLFDVYQNVPAYDSDGVTKISAWNENNYDGTWLVRLEAEWVPPFKPMVCDRKPIESILDKMHFRALDTEFNGVDIIDAYDSIIWSERYHEVGDFEIHGSLDTQLHNIALNARYILNTATSTVMEIENTTIEYDFEDAPTITISGRSLENFLDRRVTLKPLTILNPLDRRISQILCDLVSGMFVDTTSARRWDKLEIVNTTSVDSAKIPSNLPLHFEMGKNLIDIVLDFCRVFDLGFKCEFSSSTGMIMFTIYEGKDLSVLDENMVVFSDAYDNLLSGKEARAFGHLRTFGLVTGNFVDEVTQIPLREQHVDLNNKRGLDRRETHFNSGYEKLIYHPDDSTEEMPNSQYDSALVEFGMDRLKNAENKIFRDYEGEILENVYRYGIEFSLGDIVYLWLPHGQRVKARLDGITFSDDSNTGKALVPSFNYEL